MYLQKQTGANKKTRQQYIRKSLRNSSRQRRGVFRRNPTVSRDQQWRACTRLCDGSRPPPGFPPCCPALDKQFQKQPLTRWGHWFDATEQFVGSYPLAVIAIQTVFSIAVINVLVSRLGGESTEADMSGRSWDTEEQEEQTGRLLLKVLDGNWLSALEEHAMERTSKKNKRESYICCLDEGEEEQVECFTQPRHSSGRDHQTKIRFFLAIQQQKSL